MATTKRQRTAMNAVMIALAAVIVIAGIVFVTTIRGGQAQASPFTVSEKTGYANIERAGINYALDKGTVLQDGDIVEALDASEVGVQADGGTTIWLADASKMKVRASGTDAGSASLQIDTGCVFADSRGSDGSLSLGGNALSWKSGDAVYVADTHASSVNIHVLRGSVTLANGTAVKAGESYSHLAEQAQGESARSSTTSKLSLAALDSFSLQHALDTAKSGRELVVSEQQITDEQARREAEREQMTTDAGSGDSIIKKDSNESGSQQGSAGNSDGNGSSADNPNASENGGTGGDNSNTNGTGSNNTKSQNANTQKSTPGTSDGGKTLTCTVEIRCDTILNNMSKLAEGKSKYVPKSGVLLKSTTVEFSEGESAFDVLQRACKSKGIALEYSYVPLYGSYYIEGIGNLYEFDCGDESGWMYKVNGWFPNYGCSEYHIANGDAIMFCYTCNGLGEDVGA